MLRPPHGLAPGLQRGAINLAESDKEPSVII